MAQRIINWMIRYSLILFCLVFLVILPIFVTSPYIMRILVFVGIYVILVSSLNLVNGYTGLFCIGHAAFYGIGAYTSAIVVMRTGVPFWIGMVAAAIVAGFTGYLIARPAVRLKGIYLTLVTLGFNIIVMLIFLNWVSLTRGPLGIHGIPVPTLGGKPFLGPVPYYYLILAINCIVLLAISRLVNSRFGRGLKAIREDEEAAAASGVNLASYKITAFSISALIAGIAGSFYAHYMMYISPDSFTQMESFAIITMLAFGGPGNLIGPPLGAAILVTVTEAFRWFADLRMIIYGLLLIAMMLFRREGLLGGKEYSLIIQWPREKKQEFTIGDKFLTGGGEGK